MGIAAICADISPVIEQFTDELGHQCARVDQGIKIGHNTTTAPIADWARSTGSGTGVVHQPTDLTDEIGNPMMSSLQLQDKFMTAIDRAKFLLAKQFQRWYI